MHDGLLVVDKPHGLTSRAALDGALRWFPRGTKIGHTGTLDPLATGVLVLAVGRATRLTEFVQDMPKTYITDITLGARSATDDSEGPIIPTNVEAPPERASVEAVLRSFVGTTQQVPPAFSAAKLGGRRSYDLARRGQAADLAPRTVRIDRIEIVSFDYPTLRLEIDCGKGTYIRSLARDLGERLGCGGYVAALRRTGVGPFLPEQAVPFDTAAESARKHLLPLSAAVAGLPRVDLDDAQLSRFARGQAVPLASPSGVESDANVTFAAFDGTGQLCGIGRTEGIDHLLRPVKVLIG
jgi:tRNA pseudouridine55 synthase